MVQLNDFQRLMLFWNRIHPYHAIEMIQVRRPVDLAGLQRAALEELEATGIAGPCVDERLGICVFTKTAFPVETTLVDCEPGESPRACLERKCMAELNRPFRVNHDALVRFWVVPDEQGHWVGMTWQHWFCDGVTAGDLLRRILSRWLNLPAGPTVGLLDRQGLTNDRAFAKAFRPRQRVASAIEIVRALTLSPTMHLPERSAADFRVAVRFLPLPEDVLQRLQRLGRRADGTVNDALLAVFLQALDRTMPRRGWRRRLAVGNAVNLRPLSESVVDKMGLYLAIMIVFGPPRRKPRSIDDWIHHVRRQTERSKRQQTFWAGLGGMRLTRALLPWLPERFRIRAAMNVLRLTAGLSNLRYPEAWFGPEWSDAVGAYWRGIPLGLSTPLALGVTTKGDRLTASASWHPAVFSDSYVEALVSAMNEAIR